MTPNKEYILQLLVKNHWSQNKFAQKAGVSKTTVSRWIKGTRGAGKDLIAGIIMAFPNEAIDKLFFLQKPSPNGYTKSKKEA
jgi:transcriptional regulator with XRE-family HTH domain